MGENRVRRYEKVHGVVTWKSRTAMKKNVRTKLKKKVVWPRSMRRAQLVTAKNDTKSPSEKRSSSMRTRH